MPTYVYHCPAGHEFERFERKITDRSRVKCPECGRMAQRAVSGGSGFLLKGSGFYATDYKKSDQTGEKKGDEKGEKKETKEKIEKPEKSESAGPPNKSKKSPGAES